MSYFTRTIGAYINELIHFGTTSHPEMFIHTKHTDFELTSGDTSIKVAVLPLTYAMYSWSEHCESALMQK